LFTPIEIGNFCTVFDFGIFLAMQRKQSTTAVFVLFLTFCIFQICKGGETEVNGIAAAWNIVDITNVTGIESTLPPTFLSQNNLFLIVGTNEHVYLVNYTRKKIIIIIHYKISAFKLKSKKNIQKENTLYQI
jgi:hypothetical protein